MQFEGSYSQVMSLIRLEYTSELEEEPTIEDVARSVSVITKSLEALQREIREARGSGRTSESHRQFRSRTPLQRDGTTHGRGEPLLSTNWANRDPDERPDYVEMPMFHNSDEGTEKTEN